MDSHIENKTSVEINPEAAEHAHKLHEGTKVERSITIVKPIGEVFAFWRDFTNVPKFMSHVISINVTSPARSDWVVRTLGGRELRFSAEVIAESANRMLSWQTLPGSEIVQAGSVWFHPAPQDGGTEIRLVMRYSSPGGAIGSAIAQIFGEEPTQILREDLRRLRQLLEAGEIPTTEGQPHGERGLLH